MITLITNHLIVKQKEEILILFLDYNYEFSKFDNNKNIGFKARINKYIKNNNIKFNGKKIVLAVGTILIATFIYSNNDLYFNKFEDGNLINYTDSSISTTFFKNIESSFVNEEQDLKGEIINKESQKNETATSNEQNVIAKKETTNKQTVIKNSKKDSSTNNKTTEDKKTTTVIENKNTNINTNSNTNKSSNTNNSTATKNMVTVYRSDGSVLNIELEEYVIGVVSAEMPASFNIEAIKAQAILARTYALKSKQNNKKLTDTVSTQAYIDANQMKEKWGSDFSKHYNKIKEAVSATKSLCIKHEGNLIDAVYHSTSNGFTEDASFVWGYSVPYLKTVESYWDKSVSSYLRTTYKELDLIYKTFGIISFDEVKIINRNSSGRVEKIQIGDSIYEGTDMRKLLGLRSTDFDLEVVDNKLKIITRGYGHGVGMSQYGANGMAKAGYSYEKILKHYYTGVTIEKL